MAENLIYSYTMFGWIRESDGMLVWPDWMVAQYPTLGIPRP